MWNLVLLVAVCGAGVALVARMMVTGPAPYDPPEYDADRVPRVAAVRIGELGVRETFDVVNEDNVFSPQRRPYPIESKKRKVEVPPTPTPIVTELKDVSFRLYGILNYGRYNRAFLETKDPETNIIEVKGYEIGDELHGYEIVHIARQRILMRRGPEELALVFDRYGEEGVFESTYRQASQKYEIDEEEQLFEVRNNDGTKDIVRKQAVSGHDVLVPVKVDEEALVQAAEEGRLEETFNENELTVSGHRVTAREIQNRAQSRRQSRETVSGASLKPGGGSGSSRGSGGTVSGAKIPPGSGSDQQETARDTVSGHVRRNKR